MQDKYLVPFYSDMIIPDKLFFDNDSVDDLITGEASEYHSQADVLAEWLAKGSVPENKVGALVAILVHKPELLVAEDHPDRIGFLNRSLQKVEAEVNNRPEAGVELLIKHAQLLQVNGKYDASEVQYNRAYEIARQNLRLTDSIRIGILEDLASLYTMQNRDASQSFFTKQLAVELNCRELMYYINKEFLAFLQKSAKELFKSCDKYIIHSKCISNYFKNRAIYEMIYSKETIERLMTETERIFRYMQLIFVNENQSKWIAFTLELANECEFQNEGDVYKWLYRRYLKNKFIALRLIAYNMLKDCNYKDMEEIYKWLLINNFEVAGTHSHLARLYALTGQVAESQKHLQLAWEKRDFAKKFVPPRILFLQILFAMVEGDNTAGYIRAIVKALAVSGSTEEWTIEPVIDKYKEVLPPGDLEFVNRLSEVLSGRESVETMNGLPGWTNSAS